jgi:hypothetical protein
MTLGRARFAPALTALLIALVAGCGGSDESLGPESAGGLRAAASVSPLGATITRGGATTATVIFTVSGGLRINQIIVSRPFAGIRIVDKSSKTVGTTITRVFTISADSTIPSGAHQVSFKPSVTGYAGDIAPPITDAIFTLTVTQ